MLKLYEVAGKKVELGHDPEVALAAFETVLALLWPRRLYWA